MGHKELANQYAELLARLQALAEEHDRLNRSPGMQVGTQLRTALGNIKNGLLTLINLPRVARSTPAADENLIASTQFPVQSQYVYQLSAKISSTRASARACTLGIRYLNDMGTTIGFEEQGANLSLHRGFYRYLSGSPEGAPFVLDVSPPGDASYAIITVHKWDEKAGHVQLQNLHLEQEELIEALQCASFVRDLDAISMRSVKRIAVLQTLRDPDDVIAEVEKLFKNNELVILVHSQPSRLSANTFNPEKVVICSRRIFRSSYTKVAALQVGQGSYRLDAADYQSILQANYFRYRGWAVSFDDTTELQIVPNTKHDYLVSISRPQR